MTVLRPGAALALAATFLLAAACGGTSGTGSSSGCSTMYKVGLVTDVGKLSDKGFNANSWKGVQDAAADKSLCIQARALESNRSDDYTKNLSLFGSQGYNLIIAVGFDLKPFAQAYAQQNPKIKIAMVDGTADKPMANFLGLVFREDQAGYLAGAVGGLYTKSNQVAGVYGLDIPAVHRFRVGFEAGAKAVNKDLKPPLGVYQPACNCPSDFNDPAWGKARALEFIGRGADVVFGAGGATGNGALLASAQSNVACIGVDVDQFLTYPDVDSCLLTSAEKHISVAVKDAVIDAVKGRWKGGVRTFSAANDGVGVAPYHNFDSKLTADQKAKIDQISKGLKDGSIKTGAEGT
jgi:basic membrane protein A and related proteins